LPRYHSRPEFHASFAWCLLDRQNPDLAALSPASEQTTSADPPRSGKKTAVERDPPKTPFTPRVLQQINEAFGTRLKDLLPSSGWEVERIEVKVGKDIRTYDL